jgi:hypothetical protein
MAKKHHHMTKKQFNTYHKTRPGNVRGETEAEKARNEHALYLNLLKKGDLKMRQHLRDIREYSEEVLDEDVANEYDLEADRIVKAARNHVTRQPNLQRYEN